MQGHQTKAIGPLRHLIAFQECASWQSVKVKLPGTFSGHEDHRSQADRTSFRYSATLKYIEYLQAIVSGLVSG